LHQFRKLPGAMTLYRNRLFANIWRHSAQIEHLRLYWKNLRGVRVEGLPVVADRNIAPHPASVFKAQMRYSSIEAQ